jgi:hypothetical protein
MIRSRRSTAARATRPRSATPFSLAVRAVVLALLVGGCDQYLGSDNGVVVENRTTLDLHFSALLESGWYTPVAGAHPHQSALVLPPSLLPQSRCTAGAMIALAEDGREIARHEAPLCAGDRWIIDIPGAAPVPSSGGT